MTGPVRVVPKERVTEALQYDGTNANEVIAFSCGEVRWRKSWPWSKLALVNRWGNALLAGRWIVRKPIADTWLVTIHDDAGFLQAYSVKR